MCVYLYICRCTSQTPAKQYDLRTSTECHRFRKAMTRREITKGARVRGVEPRY